MTSTVRLTRTDLEKALTAGKISSMGVMRSGLILGLTLFYGMIYFLYSTHSSVRLASPDTKWLDVLSIANACYSLVAFSLAVYVSGLFLRKERLTDKSAQPTTEEYANRAIELYQSSNVIFMATLETSSLFSAAICFLCQDSGALAVNPRYWLNAIPALIMVVAGLQSFPTRERVMDALEAAFIQH
ncbi:MAG TPA: hypothetical protein VN367_01995 [Chlorobaculum sp.]|nr:hypothetical protein [Chlorobaculum sp.]